MLRDITLGQYIPGDTVIHRLDPRCKIILTILYIAIIFCVTSPVWYVIPLAYLLVASRLSGLSAKRLLKSVKPLRFLLILTFVLNLFFSAGTTVWVQWGFLRITQEGFLTAVHFSMRLVFLVAGTSLLTLTTSPVALSDGLEKLLSQQKAQKHNRTQEIVIQINQRLEQGFRDTSIGAQSIAEEMGVSAAYLRKQYLTEAGVSIGDKLNQLRVDEASRLLLETDQPIESIARQIGVENTKYFFVLFKKFKGMTPRQFRCKAETSRPL